MKSLPYPPTVNQALPSGAVVVRKFRQADAVLWDAFVAASWNGTFLHTRRFLSYHGSRFYDLSLLLEVGGKLIGVFPAALDPDHKGTVTSHPGITYGGLVHRGACTGEMMVEALTALAGWYRAQGLERLRYKAVPFPYQQTPSQDALYALFRLGARRYRADLAAVVDYAARPKLHQLRRRGLKKAVCAGVVISSGTAYLGSFWELLDAHLQEKFGVAPTHSLAECEELCRLFPEQLECVVALQEGVVVAGVLLFRHAHTVHLQYAATNAAGRRVGALDLLLEGCLERGRADGRRYFSFGISNEKEGTLFNSGLHRFKTGFGAGGVVHEFYEVDLQDPRFTQPAGAVGTDPDDPSLIGDSL